MSQIFHDIKTELTSQQSKWGEQNHSLPEWCLILGEEVGEVQKAVLEYHFKYNKHSQLEHLIEVRKELVQVAAVAISILESMQRNEIASQMCATHLVK